MLQFADDDVNDDDRLLTCDLSTIHDASTLAQTIQRLVDESQQDATQRGIKRCSGVDRIMSDFDDQRDAFIVGYRAYDMQVVQDLTPFQVRRGGE